jgi:hypothetical protein
VLNNDLNTNLNIGNVIGGCIRYKSPRSQSFAKFIFAHNPHLYVSQFRTENFTVHKITLNLNNFNIRFISSCVNYQNYRVIHEIDEIKLSINEEYFSFVNFGNNVVDLTSI